MTEPTMPAWVCLRCDHKWPRWEGRPKPKHCANRAHCGSPFWDQPVIGRWPKTRLSQIPLATRTTHHASRSPRRRPPKGVDEKQTKGNFVLYRFNYDGNRRSTPPDIIALGDTIEKVKMIIEQTYSEGDRRTAMLAAEVAPKEKERNGGYYIRRCSEKCWEKLKNKEEFVLATDPTGTWVTRKEMARIRQAMQLGEVLKHMTWKPKRSVSDDEKPPSY